MNIVKRELLASLKSQIIWSVCMVLFFLSAFTEFSAYYNNAEMLELIDSMPDFILNALNLNAANITTLSGFYSYVVQYGYIIFGVHAILLGSNIIAKEERDKTSEFLFSMPVSRKKVVHAKIISAVINVALLLIVVYFASLIMALKYNPSSEFYSMFWLSILATFILQLIFLSIGLFIASVIKKYKKAGIVSVSALFATYILSIIISLSDKIKDLKYFTPFAYFKPLDLLNENKFELVFVIISVIIILLGITVTYIFYPKRDLK